MKALTHVNDSETTEWVSAVYRDRWVEISIRYDNFSRIIHQFVIPFSNHLIAREIASSFYYHLASECDEIIQLNFRTSQYNLDAYLKPHLYDTLNHYFDSGYLATRNVRKIDDCILAKKTGFTPFTWKDFNVLGIEEFSFNHFPFTKGTFGKDELSEVAVRSSAFALHTLRQSPAAPDTTNIAAHGFTFLFPVLFTFMEDRHEIVHFCDWLVTKTHNQVEKNGVPSEHAFESLTPMLTDHSRHLLAVLQHGSVPVHPYVEEWTDHVRTLKTKLEALEARGLLHIWEHRKDPAETQTPYNLDSTTIMKWRVVAHILHTTCSQLGIRLTFRYFLYRSIKEALFA